MSERKTLSLVERDAAAPTGVVKRGRGWEISEKRLDTLHERAREMRRHPTEAQSALAKALTETETGGYSFRRQVVIGSTIVDFACKPLMMVIEIDADEDAAFAPARDRSLAEVGYRIERLTAAEVLADPQAAATRVAEAMSERWHERRDRARSTRSGPRRMQES